MPTKERGVREKRAAADKARLNRAADELPPHLRARLSGTSSIGDALTGPPEGRYWDWGGTTFADDGQPIRPKQPGFQTGTGNHEPNLERSIDRNQRIADFHEHYGHRLNERGLAGKVCSSLGLSQRTVQKFIQELRAVK